MTRRGDESAQSLADKISSQFGKRLGAQLKGRHGDVFSFDQGRIWQPTRYLQRAITQAGVGGNDQRGLRDFCRGKFGFKVGGGMVARVSCFTRTYKIKE